MELSHRINELGLKSGQVLLFLSFAMVSVATLRTVGREPTPQIPALNEALFWWKWALIPVLVGILPMKEAWWHSPSWYQVIRWARVILLWLAVALISRGVYSFFAA